MRPSQIAGYALAFVLCASLPCAAQSDEGGPKIFACDSCVDTPVVRQPHLRFEPVASVPSTGVRLVSKQAFQFDSGPLRSVSILATMTAPEGTEPGRGSDAPFELWAETRHDRDAGGKSITALTRSWHLVAERSEGDDVLRFTARGDQPPVAISRATPDSRVALFDIAFVQDFGTNANDWEMLLDFRTMPPRALVASYCAHYEGGGACTAYDSGNMPRFSLDCAWDASADDFLCAEAKDTPLSHRRYYLVSGRVPARSAGEAQTVEDAVRRLRKMPASSSLVVSGVGSVSIIHSLNSRRAGRVDIIGTPDDLLVVMERGGEAHEASQQGATVAAVNAVAGDDPPWTRDEPRSFSVRPLHQGRGLTVIQVLAEMDGVKTLYWIGIEDAAAGLIVDTKEIATEYMEYVQCNRYRAPTSIVAIGAVREPFQVSVKVQPPNVESSEEGLVWGFDPSDSEQVDCLHPGRLRWIPGAGFGLRVDTVPCKGTTKPESVRIDPTGKVRLVPYDPDR